MTIQTVVKMGNKQLGIPSEPVVDFDPAIRSYPELTELIQNMKDTMDAKGGVGIAAPQIGYNKRVIMFGFEKNKRYPNEKPVPFTILINPIYQIMSDELVEEWEGCLSVPGLRGLVPRYKKIEYSGYDPEGKLITRVAADFHARIIQHECDHLDGVLFPYRLKDIRFFGYEEELKDRIYL